MNAPRRVVNALRRVPWLLIARVITGTAITATLALCVFTGWRMVAADEPAEVLFYGLTTLTFLICALGMVWCWPTGKGDW